MERQAPALVSPMLLLLLSVLHLGLLHGKMSIVRCHLLKAEITKALQAEARPTGIQGTSFRALGRAMLIVTALTAKGGSFELA